MTASVTTDMFEAMRQLDGEIEACVGVPASLAPSRDRASSLEAIAERLLAARDPAWQVAFVAASRTVVRALIEHFPGNIFWDLDFLFAALLEEAATTDELLELGSSVARLQVLFGRHSLIAFRYLHDFTYGFDWARWTERRPEQRVGIGPFSAAFMAHVERRGVEITAAIEAGDPRFPVLKPGEFRNPFPFSRTPRHERSLLEDLAAQDLVPIHTWRIEARPRYDLPFAARREERAKALGIPPGPQQGS